MILGVFLSRGLKMAQEPYNWALWGLDRLVWRGFDRLAAEVAAT